MPSTHNLDINDWMTTIQYQSQQHTTNRFNINDTIQFHELIHTARTVRQQHNRTQLSKTASKVKSIASRSDILQRSIQLNRTINTNHNQSNITSIQPPKHLFTPLNTKSQADNVGNVLEDNNSLPSKSLCKSYSELQLQQQSQLILHTQPLIDQQARHIKQNVLRDIQPNISNKPVNSGRVPHVDITSLDLSMLTLSNNNNNNNTVQTNDIIKSMQQRKIDVKLINDNNIDVDDGDMLNTTCVADISMARNRIDQDISTISDNTVRSIQLNSTVVQSPTVQRTATQQQIQPTLQHSERTHTPQSSDIHQSINSSPVIDISQSTTSRPAPAIKQPINYDTPFTTQTVKLHTQQYKRFTHLLQHYRTKSIFDVWHNCIIPSVQQSITAQQYYNKQCISKYMIHWRQHTKHTVIHKQRQYIERQHSIKQQHNTTAYQYNTTHILCTVLTLWYKSYKKSIQLKQLNQAKNQRQNKLIQLLNQLTVDKPPNMIPVETISTIQPDNQSITNMLSPQHTSATITKSTVAPVSNTKRKVIKPHTNIVPALPIQRSGAATSHITPSTTTQRSAKSSVHKQSTREQRLAERQALLDQQQQQLADQQRIDAQRKIELKSVQSSFAQLHSAHILLIDTFNTMKYTYQRSSMAWSSAVQYSQYQRYKRLFQQWRYNIHQIIQQRQQIQSDQLHDASILYNDKLLSQCYILWKHSVPDDSALIHRATQLDIFQTTRRMFSLYKQHTLYVIQQRVTRLHQLELQCQPLSKQFTLRRYLYIWIDATHTAQHNKSFHQYKQYTMNKVSGWLNEYKRDNQLDVHHTVFNTKFDV